VYERCHKRRTYFHLAHAAATLFDRALEFGHSAYEPTVRDRLLIQQRLGGIVKSQLSVDGQRAEVFYVGQVVFVLADCADCADCADMLCLCCLYCYVYQRTERRRWLHIFEDVAFVWYHASLAEFNELLYEDEQTNRMTESIQLWTQIANSRWFRAQPFIMFFLVFTHTDVLRAKLERGAQFKRHAPGYTGDNSFDSVLQHIRDMYLAVAPHIRVETFAVNVLDENDVRTVARAFRQHAAAANALTREPLASASAAV
jgi:hypothetical protein